MRQSNHDTLSDVIVQEERCAYTHSQKISIRGRGECVRCFQQHKFNNENRIVCVWEAQLVKAVSLNLTHPYPHVIPVLSHFLPLCTEKIISKHFNNYFEQPTLKAKWKIASPATELGQYVIFSLVSDLFATLVMTRRSHSVKGTKEKLALNKSKIKWFSSASFWQSGGLQALHLCFKSKIKETVYSSAGYRAGSFPHCLAAWMPWQLALALMVSSLPTNEYRQEFKAVMKSSDMTPAFTFQDFADTDGTKETANTEDVGMSSPTGKISIDQMGTSTSHGINLWIFIKIKNKLFKAFKMSHFMWLKAV